MTIVTSALISKSIIMSKEYVHSVARSRVWYSPPPVGSPPVGTFDSDIYCLILCDRRLVLPQLIVEKGTQFILSKHYTLHNASRFVSNTSFWYPLALT